MTLMDIQNEEANWFEALSIWNKVANWSRFRQTDAELKSQMRYLIVLLWNEKDWLLDSYPSSKKNIEKFIDTNKYLKIIADLANTIKHKKIARNIRANARFTNYRGKTCLGSGSVRSYHFIAVGKEFHVEIMAVLRGAIEEIELLKFQLRRGLL